MRLIIEIIQIITAVGLTAAILVKQTGTGLGAAWGGSGEFYSSRRGVEKAIFNATIILGVFFLAVSVAAVLIK